MTYPKKSVPGVKEFYNGHFKILQISKHFEAVLSEPTKPLSFSFGNGDPSGLINHCPFSKIPVLIDCGL